MVSLYTNQTVSDPAALTEAILTSAPLMATAQPLPGFTSVPVHLHLKTQDAAAAVSQNPLQSAPTANTQENLSPQTNTAADGEQGSEETSPVASSDLTSEPQVNTSVY